MCNLFIVKFIILFIKKCLLFILGRSKHVIVLLKILRINNNKIEIKLLVKLKLKKTILESKKIKNLIVWHRYRIRKTLK
jgi:predicted nuclease of predicted toxin-antitoxin system